MNKAEFIEQAIPNSYSDTLCREFQRKLPTNPSFNKLRGDYNVHYSSEYDWGPILYSNSSVFATDFAKGFGLYLGTLFLRKKRGKWFLEFAQTGYKGWEVEDKEIKEPLGEDKFVQKLTKRHLLDLKEKNELPKGLECLC